MANYYDGWQERRYECKACNWVGTGAQLGRGEYFQDLFEVTCPKCENRLGVVMYPTLKESRDNWDKVSPADRAAVEIAEANQREFDRRSLKTVDQLPDLHGDELILQWDNEGRDTVIRHGDQVVWREPCVYEGYERFRDVAEILVSKYGRRLKDLVPTAISEDDLYGDRLSSPRLVQRFREQIQAGNSPE